LAVANTQKTTDVIIIGGGVIGCAIAYHLAKAGVKATVLERAHVAAEASSAAAGLIAPLAEVKERGPFLDLCVTSGRLFPQEVQDIELASGMNVGYVQSGFLQLAFSPAEEEALKARLVQQQDTGLRQEWLGAKQVLSVEPGVNSAVLGGIYSPEEPHIDSQRLTEAYAKAATALGGDIRTGIEVTSLLRNGDRVRGVRSSSGIIYAAQTVLAAGAWTAKLARQLGWELPIRPVRGQMLAFADAGQPIRRVVWGKGAYLVPKANDTVFVGATVEDVGFRRRTTTSARDWMLRSARTLVPALSSAHVARHWAGFRPATVDHLPILGPLPGWEGVSVASGHFRNGILLAPLTARLATQWLTDGETDVPLEPFSPARFVSERTKAVK
jgi:glycine oxidase